MNLVYRLTSFIIFYLIFLNIVFGQYETQYFSGDSEINVPDFSPANIYPSIISVSGMPVHLSHINISFEGLSHFSTSDFDILLEAPDGTLVTIFSDVPNYSSGFSGYGEVHLDMDALTILSSDNYTGNDDLYLPTNKAPILDSFPDFGLINEGSSFTPLQNIDPNGEWKLYVFDDENQNISGSIGGWSMSIESTNQEVCNIPQGSFTAELIECNQVNLLASDLDGAQWDLLYSSSAVMEIDYSTEPSIENISSNNYTLSDLDYDQSYIVYYRRDCDGDNQRVSRWRGPYSVTTGSGVCATAENIEDCTITEFSDSFSESYFQDFFDPCMTSFPSSRQLMYNFNPSSNGDYFLNLIYNYSDPIQSIAYKTQTGSVEKCDSTNWKCVELNQPLDFTIPSLSNDSTYKILIHADNSFIFTIGQCPYPRGITLNNTVSHAFDIDMEFEQNNQPLVGEFDIFYSDDPGFMPDDNTPPSVSNVTISDGKWSTPLGSLSADTEYNLYIRSICDDKASCWVGSHSISTTKYCGGINADSLDVRVTGMTSWIRHTDSEFNSLLILYDDQPFPQPEYDTPASINGITSGYDFELDHPGVFLYQLSPNTTYTYYLKQLCGGPSFESQSWVGPFTFTTDSSPYITPEQLYCNQCVEVNTSNQSDPKLPSTSTGNVDIFPNPMPNACVFEEYDPKLEKLWQYDATETGAVTMKKILSSFCTNGGTEFMAQFYIKSANRVFNIDGWEYLGCAHQVASSSNQNVLDDITFEVEKDSSYYIIADIQGESCNASNHVISRYEIEGNCSNPCLPPTNLISTPTNSGYQTVTWDEVSGALGYQIRFGAPSQIQNPNICLSQFYTYQEENSLEVNVDSLIALYQENTPLSAIVRVLCDENNYSSWSPVSLTPLLSFHSEYRTDNSIGQCSPTYNRTSLNQLDDVPYDLVEFEVESAGLYAFNCRSFSNSTGTHVAVYQGDFNQLLPQENLLIEQGSGSGSENFTLTLDANTPYIIVASAVGITSNPFTYIVSCDGPNFLVTDGYTYNGTHEGPRGMVPTSDGIIYIANKVCPDEDGWRHYYYSDPNNTNGEDYILLSIVDYPNIAIQQNASFAMSGGSAGASTITNPPADYVTTNEWNVMNRHWNFEIPDFIQPPTITDIKFYYTQADLDALAIATDNPMLDHSDLHFSKVNDQDNQYDINPINGHVGIPAAINCADNGIWEYKPGLVSDSITWVGAEHPGGFFAQMSIHSFSGGGGGVGSFQTIEDIDNDGYTNETDCNDNDPDINPGADEILYNGINDDCDATTLDDDLDEDGFLLVDDCDDEDANINPNAIEIPYNQIDEDCDPTTLDDDLDDDGFLLEDDCDDLNADINPDKQEIPYNEIDDDCDPTTLDDDLDEDGFLLENDCDDLNPNINPEAEEIPDNDIDEDCDGNDLTTSIEYINKDLINVYPNPIISIMIVEQKGLTNPKATIQDISGKIILSRKLKEKNVFDWFSYPNGLYFIIISSDEGVYSKKLIKL